MRECKTFEFHIWNSKIFSILCFFNHGSSDGEGLSQQYLQLVNAYKKRFMSQNGQVAVLKCCPLWKKMWKSFKTLSELKAQIHPQKEASKREAMAVLIGKRTLHSFWEKSSNRKV